MATFIAMTRESARRIDRTRLPNDPAGKDFVCHWNDKDKMWEVTRRCKQEEVQENSREACMAGQEGGDAEVKKEVQVAMDDALK
ncbi:hypothetical protein CSUB01_12407 [Colletotrichum sublineola]|uniref:Uncharacterized protein n=1 Tax=Colletotrichum sublineola TaxID=1173701 RepID=A0A066XGZ4_COLSU|nr:hypothetical protein CSUB01_12407 [Colletotrichum sublineola]